MLDLFKYYGQTVVNFRSNCNAAAKKENIYDIINYSNKDSVFTITKGEVKQQSVKINREQPWATTTTTRSPAPSAAQRAAKRWSP